VTGDGKKIREQLIKIVIVDEFPNSPIKVRDDKARHSFYLLHFNTLIVGVARLF